MIITHPALMGPELDGYESYINGKGYSTKVVSVLDIYEANGYGMIGVSSIREYLDEVRDSLGIEYVVIVGGTTTEYPGVGESISYVPTDFELTNGFIYHTPCDGCVVDFTGDMVPELKIFRVPSRENSDTQAVVSKAGAYTPGSSVLLIAEHTQGSNFGAQLDGVSDELGGYTKTKVYLDQVAAENGLTLPDDLAQVTAIAKTQMISEMNSGQRLVMFDGHGGPTRWTFNNLFTVSDAGGLGNTVPNVVIPLTCYTTYYAFPGTFSLADQLLFNPSGGSVVVSGAAVLSSLVDNGVYAKSILNKMCTGKNLAEAVFETKVERPSLTDQLINWDTIGDGFTTIDSCTPETSGGGAGSGTVESVPDKDPNEPDDIIPDVDVGGVEEDIEDQ